MGNCLDCDTSGRRSVHRHPRGALVVADGTAGALHRGMRHDGRDAHNPRGQATPRPVTVVRCWPRTTLLMAASFVAGMIIEAIR